MQVFRPHPVILRLQELPDHVLRALIESHKVTERAYLDDDHAGDQITAWHVAFGKLLRDEQHVRKNGGTPPEIYQLLTIANRCDNDELSSVLAYLKEMRDSTFQPPALKRFAQALGMEISAMIVNEGMRESGSQIPYN